LKPVFIIAIAVVCSVVAVLGVLVGLEQIATMQAQQAYDEYQKSVNQQQMEIVDAYNLEILRCNTVFVDNIMGKYQCSDNAVDSFQIYRLDEYHYEKLKYVSSTSEDSSDFKLPQTYAEAEHRLKQLEKQIEESHKSLTAEQISEIECKYDKSKCM
jgi:pyruvate/2-oxoacid:ferredoxin oxidoreductase beta subunit